MWLDPSHSGKDIAWRHPWPEDIITNIVSSTNREGEMTNSDSDLVLHEAILLSAESEARMAAPIYGSDNTLTVSWSTREASTIQPVVAELIRIRVLHSRQF